VTTVFGVGMGEEWGKAYFSRWFHVEQILPMHTKRIRISGCSERIKCLITWPGKCPETARYVPIDSITCLLYMGERP
jgi:hypothetical protein